MPFIQFLKQWQNALQIVGGFKICVQKQKAALLYILVNVVV
jgi:hypothetical protein